jgi:hypothetical protein
LLELMKETEAKRNKHTSTSDLHANLLPAFDDIFTDTMRPVWKQGKVTMRSVFAARVMLDILDICPHFDGKTLLHDEGHRQHEYFEFYVDSEGALDMRSGFRWLARDMNLVMEIYSRIKQQMLEPTFPHLKEMMLAQDDAAHAAQQNMPRPTEEDLKNYAPNRIVKQTLSGSLQPRILDDRPDLDEETKQRYDENAKKLNLQPVRPHRDTHLYLNKNPLYCGTLMLSQIVSTEAAGIALANHHRSIFAVAHLYNALHKMNLTKVAWPDLDRIIELQRGPIFADDVPSTPEEMQARVMFRLGVDRTLTQLNVHSTTLAKKDLAMSNASTLLMQFFRSKQPLETTIYQLQANIEQKQLAETQSAKGKGIAKPPKTKPLALLSQRAFINQLEDFANAAISENHSLPRPHQALHSSSGVRERAPTAQWL